MKAVATTMVPVLNVERTEEELLEAMQDFAIASCELVGISNTYETVNFLTKTIQDSPETYQKILTPKALKKFAELIERSKSGQMGLMEIMSAFSEVKEVLQ